MAHPDFLIGEDGEPRVPTLTELFMADEQPQEANPQTLDYLRANPHMQALIDRQKRLERLALEASGPGLPEDEGNERDELTD